MTSRRLGPVLLVVPLGMLVGHQVAYGVLPQGLGDLHAHPHGHLVPLAALAAPLSLCGLLGLVRGAGRARLASTVGALAGAQSLAFAAMEVVERLSTGGATGELVRSSPLWTGIAVQFAVALSLWLVGTLARRAAFSLLLLTTLGPGLREPTGVLTVPRNDDQTPRPLATLRWLLQRGPPLLLDP